MNTLRPSEALNNGRETIRALASKFNTQNPRVFGSVLTGRDTTQSDLDIIVDALPNTTLFQLAGLQDALEEALGVAVDVLTPGDLPPHIRRKVLANARPV